MVMRSLVKRGCEVSLLDHDVYCAGFHSRRCSGAIVTPPESQKDQYIDALIQILNTQKFDLLIPISDFTTEFLSEERDRITPYTRMLLPSKELIAMARHKDKAYRFMLENNIAIPTTYFPQSPDDVARFAPQLSYPCVVKKPRGTANHGNAYCRDKGELEGYFRNRPAEDPWPVMQEFVEGKFYGFTAIVSDGEILDCFMYAAEQEYALNGTPPYGATIIDQEFFQVAQKIIRLLKWTGAISFDFIKAKDGTIKFLEINPRLPGSLDFIYAAGLDFPSLYLDLALGKKLSPFKGFAYKPGMKFRYVLPMEIIYASKKKKHFLKMFVNFLNPWISTDIPWDDPRLLYWKLKHVRWYWQDKNAEEALDRRPFA